MLYYLPAVHTPRREKIRECGIEYAFESAPAAAQVMRGPCEGPGGVILCDPRAAHADRLGYYPEEQTWRKIPGASSCTEHGSVCVGYWNDARPGPEQLAKRSQLPGHRIELADGNTWLAPMAVSWQGSEPAYPVLMLPRAVGLDESGEWINGDVLPAYAHIWDIAQRWQAALGAKSDQDGNVRIELELRDIFDDAVACLAVNYRVSKVEVAMLGLLTELFAARVLNAVLDDIGYWEIAQKKTEY